MRAACDTVFSSHGSGDPSTSRTDARLRQSSKKAMVTASFASSRDGQQTAGVTKQPRRMTIEERAQRGRVASADPHPVGRVSIVHTL